MKQSKLEAVVIFAVAALMVLSTTVCVNAMIMLDGSNLVLSVIGGK